MKLSAPIFQLKRRAKLMARTNNVPLHKALDQVAHEEGFARWSLLSSQVVEATLSETILSRLDDGDLLLLAGRPGHGKTTLGLQLLLDSARDNRKAVFFTLVSTEQQAKKHILSLEKEPLGVADRLEIVTSDEISADYIIRHLSGSERGTVAVIDYLQILYGFRLIDSAEGGFPARIERFRLVRHEWLEAGHGDDSCAYERRCVV
jgi:predicted ATP-dependent serine protease